MMIFKGSMVAIVTPMRADGSIDYDTYADLIEFHIEEGTDVLVPAGTTGESATLDFDEHCEVVRFAIERVGGRIPVMAGTGSNATKEAIELTRSAKNAGADGCLLVTPYYNKPTQEGLYQHYKAIAKEVSLPQILYNVPGRTACDMLPDTIERLSALPEVIGVKEATGLLERSFEIMQRCGDDFAVISGEDFAAREVILGGGKGVISVTANVAPKLMHELTVSALAGQSEASKAIDQKLAGLHSALFIESNPTPTKWALYKMGKISQGIRLPLLKLSEQCQQEVLNAMKQAGVTYE